RVAAKPVDECGRVRSDSESPAKSLMQLCRVGHGATRTGSRICRTLMLQVRSARSRFHVLARAGAGIDQFFRLQFVEGSFVEWKPVRLDNRPFVPFES